MKLGLLATTALVASMAAGTAFAGDVSLGLGGYVNVGIAASSQGSNYSSADDDTIRKDFWVVHDGEIHFKGVGTLDNGIQIVTRVELETASEGDQIDEQWVQVKSQFGTLMIGGNDDAAYAISRAGMGNVGIGMGAWGQTYDAVPGYVGELGGKDSFGIHYYTPRIAGFEAGISWQPTIPAGVDAAAFTDADADTDNSRDRISVGAAYDGNFGDVSFTIDGRYVHTDGAAGSTVDETGYAIGAGIGFSGFTIAGRWEHVDDISHVSGDETNRYGGHVGYSTGPWKFAAGIAFEDNDTAAAGGDSEELAASIGASYELGAGVSLGGAVQYGSVDVEGASPNDADDIAGLLLLGVSF